MHHCKHLNIQNKFTNDNLVYENRGTLVDKGEKEDISIGIICLAISGVLYLAPEKQVQFKYSGALVMEKNGIYFNIALSDIVRCCIYLII